MRRLKRISGMVAALGVAGANLVLVAVPAQAAAQTLTIGVDNATPAGRNFEFLDYYPRTGVNVHNGDTIAFKYNTASPDGFHTATLGACHNSSGALTACAPGQTTETAGQIYGATPQTVPDQESGASTGDGPNQMLFNNAIAFASSPPPGSGAPGACGDVATPCPWDGSKEVNTGAMGNAPGFGTQYFIKVNLASAPSSAITVNYVCLVHGPAMSANFTVVPDATTASTQADLDTAAASQYAPQPAAGAAAANAVSSTSTMTNANGSHTVTMTAGAETADGRVQVLEMLPASLNIKAGDTVTWASRSQNDIHTVTFPQGNASLAVDPFPSFCETNGGTDTAPNFAAQGPPCPQPFPSTFETHFNPQPQGTAVISTPTTLGTSGIILAAGTPAPFPAAFSFSFPNAGTFTYMCRIHDHMTGQVLAAAIAPATLAQTGAGSRPSSAPAAGILLALLGAAIAGVMALAVLVRVRAARA